MPDTGVTLVSAGGESAFERRRLLKANGLRADENRHGKAAYSISSRAENFEEITSRFCRRICIMKPTKLTLTGTEPLAVVLSVRGEQYFDGVDPDSTELMTEGTLTVTDEGLLLSYQETQLTGMEGTTTTFEVRGPQVILTRSGKVNSQMVFEEGRQHTSLYETPFGELSVDIQTSRLRHNLSEGGGTLEIQYSIAVEHTVTGKNRFQIRVRRKQ